MKINEKVKNKYLQCQAKYLNLQPSICIPETLAFEPHRISQLQFRGTIPPFAWNNNKPQSKQPVSGPRFEPGTSRRSSRSVNHSTTTFGWNPFPISARFLLSWPRLIAGFPAGTQIHVGHGHFLDRSMALAVSRGPLATEARVRARASPCEIWQALSHCLGSSLSVSFRHGSILIYHLGDEHQSRCWPQLRDIASPRGHEHE
jgi:hypothetical protein